MIYCIPENTKDPDLSQHFTIFFCSKFFFLQTEVGSNYKKTERYKKLIERNIDGLKQLCSTYNVDKMYLFGSALNSNFSDKSDIDFLVKFKSIELSQYFENYINLKENLKKLFGREVDLLE